jgi:hypothetical protein
MFRRLIHPCIVQFLGASVAVAGLVAACPGLACMLTRPAVPGVVPHPSVATMHVIGARTCQLEVVKGLPGRMRKPVTPCHQLRVHPCIP